MSVVPGILQVTVEHSKSYSTIKNCASTSTPQPNDTMHYSIRCSKRRYSTRCLYTHVSNIAQLYWSTPVLVPHSHKDFPTLFAHVQLIHHMDVTATGDTYILGSASNGDGSYGYHPETRISNKDRFFFRTRRETIFNNGRRKAEQSLAIVSFLDSGDDEVG